MKKDDQYEQSAKLTFCGIVGMIIIVILISLFN